MPDQVNRTTSCQGAGFILHYSRFNQVPQRSISNPVIPLVLVLNFNLAREKHRLAIGLEERFQRLSCVLLTRIWRLFICIKVITEIGVHRNTLPVPAN